MLDSSIVSTILPYRGITFIRVRRRTVESHFSDVEREPTDRRQRIAPCTPWAGFHKALGLRRYNARTKVAYASSAKIIARPLAEEELSSCRMRSSGPGPRSIRDRCRHACPHVTSPCGKVHFPIWTLTGLAHAAMPFR